MPGRVARFPVDDVTMANESGESGHCSAVMIMPTVEVITYSE